jgi:hypothetical protein
MSGSFKVNTRGATLPLTVIVLALMAVAVAITLTRINAERHIGGDARDRLGAFGVAQSGLNRYMSTVNGKPAVPVAWPGNPVIQSVTYNDLPGGTAQVDVMMLRESTVTMLPAVYVITSRGTYTAARRFSALTPPAERIVATYALFTPTPFDLNAAFTSLTQVQQNGAGSGGLSGVDRCAAANGGGLADIAGVGVPTTGAAGAPPDYLGSTAPIDGNPNDAPIALGTPGAAGTAKDAVNIDWAGILAGTAFPVDYNNTWPASFANWPVTKYTGDLNPMPSSGNGILIVTGNLTVPGTPLRTWNGVILVGGNLISNGQFNVFGAVITGLNVKVGGAVGVQSVGNGTKTYQYDSCSIGRAMGHLGSMQRIRNGWTDTWSSY